MNASELSLFLGAVSGLFAGLAGAYALLRRTEAETRKIRADSGSVEVETARDVIADLRGEVDRLHQRISALEAEVRTERDRTESVSVKYQKALDQIVTLEAENRTLARRMSEMQLELRKQEIALAGCLEANGGSWNGGAKAGVDKSGDGRGVQSPSPDAGVR
jgi:hypothetical protein